MFLVTPPIPLQTISYDQNSDVTITDADWLTKNKGRAGSTETAGIKGRLLGLLK